MSIKIVVGPYKCYICGCILHNENLDFDASDNPGLKCSKCNSLTMLEPQNFVMLGAGGLMNKYRAWILGLLALVIALIGLL